MSPLPDVLRSRVGRRVLLFFFVTALLPLLLMALLSLSQVRTLLLEQGSARIANTAKVYATDVYERLLSARNAAMLAVSSSSTPASVSRAVLRNFVFLAAVTPDGRMRTQFGVAPPAIHQALQAFRGSLVRSESLLSRAADGQLLLLQRVPGPDGSVLVGELDPAYVWGEEDELKAGFVLCVVDGGTLAQLHCPKGQAMNLAEAVKAGSLGIESRDIVWEQNADRYRARVWGQYMLNDFGTADWYFAIGAPETDILTPMYAFGRVYLPILALALLLIVWVSMHQVGTTLLPLGKLAASTRRLGTNDFSARVQVTSDDEFGELGEAFNTMADRLDRRFRLSTAQAEIDRLILERTALDAIVECTLRHARALVPTAGVKVILLDHSGASSARLMEVEADPDLDRSILRTRTISMSAAQRPAPTSPLMTPYAPSGPAPEWLSATPDPTPASLWICPLTWGTVECGWLLVATPPDGDFSDEGLRMIDSLANRLAVAAASAWREGELFQRAHYDTLTGLANRELFTDRLEHEIVRCKRDGKALAVMFIDLDQFKAVNDSHGHSAGDLLLCEAANRIRTLVRDGDTVSRRGGDEFTLLAIDVREQRDALSIAQSIIGALSQPFVVNGHQCFLSASVGIALYPDNGATAELLLKHADTSMYRAKATGRGQVMFFEDRMNVEAMNRVAVDRGVRQALELGELVLHYQPQVELASNRVVSAEALIRWNHPTRGLLGPFEFIPIAEEGPLICAIGRWVLEEACRQIRQWRSDGLPIERVSVNVSARQFHEDDFIDHVRATVVEPGLAPHIEFEITESVLLEQSTVLVEKLNELRAFGSTIALDDFGTGFSSLAYLKSLPVHAVKIDRMFVDDIDRSVDARAFVEAMIVMSHVLGRWVVAEGAERHSHVAVLRELGCELVQGYVYSRPLPAADFETFVRTFGREEPLRAA